MKQICFTLAFIGLTSVTALAQAKTCSCKKVVHHKTVAHHRAVAGLKTTTPPLYTNRTHNVSSYPGNDVWKPNDVAPVNGNAAGMYNASVEYSTESSFTGNYPKPTMQDTKVDPRENSTRRPDLGDLCLYNCK